MRRILKQSYFSGEGIKRQLLRAFSGGLVVRVLSLLATVLLSVALARFLGPTNYGVYVFAISVTSLLALPVQAGLPMLVIRDTARAEASRDWVALHSIRVWALRVILAFGAIVTAAALMGAWAFSNAVSTEKLHSLLLAIVLIVPMAVTGTYSAVLRGLRCVILGQLPSEVLKPILICAFLVGAWILRRSIVDAVSALELNLVATMIVLSISGYWAMRALPQESRSSHSRAFKHVAWGQALLPLALMSSLHMINQNADLVMLGLMRAPEEVSQYKIAVSAAAFIIFGLSTIQVVAMPYVSQLYMAHDRRRLQRLAAACAGGSMLLAVPIFLAYLFFGRELISLVYGADFVQSWEPLIILSIAQMVNGFFGIVWPLLSMTGHERVGAQGLAIATVANLVLNALMIPVWGTIGAATATSISIVVWNVIFWFAVKKHLGIDGALTGLLRHAPLRRSTKASYGKSK